MKKSGFILKHLSLNILMICLLSGCATAPMKFDPNVSEPQLIVAPRSIRLGIARLVNDTKIEFKGRGFEPGDSVFINLLGVEKEGSKTDIAIAEATVNEDGQFTAEVAKLVKITELLQADVGLNDEMETYVIVSRPTIPAGNYVARAESMESDKRAQCQLIVQDPSVGDNIKDWIGGLLGKIEKK